MKVDHGNTVYSCVEDPICPSGLVCEEGVCVAEGGNGDIDAGPNDPDAEVVTQLRGDLLYLTFDDYRDSRVVHDRTGARRDGFFFSGSSIGEGVFGGAVLLGGGGVRVLDRDELFVDGAFTFEAHVFRFSGGIDSVIFSDADPDELTDNVEIEVGINANDELVLTLSGACGADAQSVASEGTVLIGAWQHVAVVSDGDTVSFFLDGEAAGTASIDGEHCQSQGARDFFIGQRSDGTGPIDGLVDELKLSGTAKSPQDLLQSLAHDSVQEDLARCGDNLIDTEACEPFEACCRPNCELRQAGFACGDGGSCNDRGACEIDGGRIGDGLVALYEFAEDAGTTIADTSGVDPAADLTISDALAVTHLPGQLQIDSEVIIASATPAAKVSNALEATNELTLEAWVVPANDNQGGPSRIITLSPNTSLRNFTLGQEDESYVARIRSGGNFGGAHLIDAPRGDVTPGELTHLVVTRDAQGLRRLYVNGQIRSENTVGGSFGSWDDAYPIGIANEATGERLWLGVYHLAAVYSKALSPDEVARNFTAGPDASTP